MRGARSQTDRFTARRSRRTRAAGAAAGLLGGLAVLLLLLVAPALAHSPRARSSAAPGSPKPVASASLEQCETADSQDARSATFAAEMTAVAGTERMQISIGILERLPGEPTYHPVDAPGLDAWRSSQAGVQSYKYLRQVTNLAAPASYRAAIRFRWLGPKGRLIQTLELRTHRCEQPAAIQQPAATLNPL
jgi:hypothetical protein